MRPPTDSGRLVPLSGGLVLPVSVIERAIDLESRGVSLRRSEDGRLAVDALASELDVKPNSITQALIRDERAARGGKVRQFMRLPDARVGLLQREA